MPRPSSVLVIGSALLVIAGWQSVDARAAHAEDHSLAAVAEAPEGLAAEIAETLSPEGHKVSTGGSALCEVWFVKSPTLVPEFKPSLAVKYPLKPGQLVGVLQVAEGGDYTDFRGQAIEPGVYTLRYGRQPQDGNHIGTSDVEDFLVAIPADEDVAPAVISDVKKLFKLSGSAAGSNHPAIFSLLPVEGEITETKLVHEDVRDLWILETVIPAGDAGSKKLPLRLVVAGHAEA